MDFSINMMFVGFNKQNYQKVLPYIKKKKNVCIGQTKCDFLRE